MVYAAYCPSPIRTLRQNLSVCHLYAGLSYHPGHPSRDYLLLPAGIVTLAIIAAGIVISVVVLFSVGIAAYPLPIAVCR